MTVVELDQVHEGSRRDLRVWTKQALRDVAYAAAVLVWSIAGFTILVTGLSVTATLLVLVIGVPIWIGFTYVLRWTTRVDRTLAGWQRGEHIAGVYRRPEARGFVPCELPVPDDLDERIHLGVLGLQQGEQPGGPRGP